MKKLLFSLGFSTALLFTAADSQAQTLSPLPGVIVSAPGTGQTVQDFTYSCSVSGCASGTVIPAFAPTQGNALLSASNPLFVAPGTSSVFAISATTLPLPTGAATSALQTTGNTELTTINTTLGTPMQNSGGTVTVTQATATNLNTASTPATAAAWGLFADNAAWSVGASIGATMECEFTTGGATTLTTAHVGAVGCTSARAAFSDIESISGTALASAISPYGTVFSGTASGEVLNVNAFVSNTNSNGSNTSANSSPVVIASDQAAVAIKAASGALVAGSIADLAHGQGTMAASVPVAIASNQSSIPVAGSAANGAAVSGNPILSGGSDGTDARTFLTSTTGHLVIDCNSAGGTCAGSGGTASTFSTTFPTTGTAAGAEFLTTAPTLTNGQMVPFQTDLNGNLKIAVVSSPILSTNIFQGSSPISNINGIFTNLLQNNAVLSASNPIFATLEGTIPNPGTASSWGILAQGSTTSGELGQLAMGAVTTAAPSYTTAQSSPLSLDTAGNLRINCITGCAGSGGTSSSFSATFPAVGTAAGAEFLTTPPTLSNGQMVAFQVTSAGSLHTTIDNTNANGSNTSANSSPVVIASDQAAVATKTAGVAASGAAVSGNPVLSGGSDGTDARTFLTSTTGHLVIDCNSAGGSCAGSGGTSSTFGAAEPTAGTAVGAVTGGATGGDMVGIIQANASLPINITTATTTQVIALISGRATYITAFDLVSAGAGTAQLEYGTGTNCSTVVGTLTGAYPFAAGGGRASGGGLGPMLIVPASDEVCVVTTSSATAQGFISFAQF
jgi:hypothetical protein